MRFRFIFFFLFTLISTFLIGQQDPTRGGFFFSSDLGSLTITDTLSFENKIDNINTFGVGYQYYMTENSGHTGFGFRIGLHFGDLFLLRLGPTYNLGKGRLQFPIGILGNIAATTNENNFGKSGAVYSLEPLLGVQFYLTNRIYLQGEAKYFWGVRFGERANETTYNEPLGGALFNIRIGLNFPKRLSKM